MAGFQNLGRRQAPPEEAQVEGGEQPASDEEQAQYEEIVARGLALIFEGDDASSAKPRDAIINALSSGNPTQALGELAGQVFFRVMQVAAENGVDISDEDLQQAAGTELFEVLAEVASAAKIYDFLGDQEQFDAAYMLAVDTYRSMAQEAGLIDQDHEAEQFRQLAQADQDGQLEGIMARLQQQGQG